jgi:hypothetical protein
MIRPVLKARRVVIVPLSVRLALTPTRTFLLVGNRRRNTLGKFTFRHIVQYLKHICSWLYRLILTIDANFRLKNKDRKNVKADDALGDGWAHWVPGVPYQQYVDAQGHKVEVRIMYVVSITDPDPCHSRISVTPSYMRSTMQIKSFRLDTTRLEFVG